MTNKKLKDLRKGDAMWFWHFTDTTPTCEERYASVCPPKLIDDWWPWLFAKTHNRLALAAGTKKDILLIDFVDIK